MDLPFIELVYKILVLIKDVFFWLDFSVLLIALFVCVFVIS